jgi:anaerobic selenocysteine-containing dehydrogenase
MKRSSEGSFTRRSFLQTAGLVGIGSAVAAGTTNLLGLPPQLHSSEEKAIPTFCAMCGPSLGCGIYAIVKDGKLIRVEGMKESPLNRGRNCPKAHAAAQWVYSPQRLKYPLLRVGKRGDGKFEKISWDQAIDHIAAKLKEQKEKYGPESLAVLSPARRTYSGYMQRFLQAHGSPNYGHSGICMVEKTFVFGYTIGSATVGGPVPDYAKTNCLFIWGTQPIYSGSSKGQVKRLLDCKARGAKIIAIKPTMEPDVAIADIWVPIRPGTDAALALAMLNVIITEKLYDAAFVEEWTYGFDKLAAHVQKYTPEWAEPITGIPAQQTKDVARIYANTKHAAIDHGNGFEHAPSCNDAIRAVGALMAIAGHLDRPGGNLFPGKPPAATKPVELNEKITQGMIDKLVCPEFPKALQPFIEGTSSAYNGVIESVLTGKPYPIRGIIAPGTQPMVSTRNPKGMVNEALKKVDFFAVVDVMRTAEMNYADIVLPVTTMYETDHPFEAGGNWVMARNRVIEPLGPYKSDYEFWVELAVKMGYGKDFWNGSLTECMNDQLSPLGITIDELRAKPNGIVYEMKPPVYEKYKQVFNSPSPRLSKAPYLPQGKVALYNTTFEELGMTPMPEWKAPPESPGRTPELLAKYPLTFSDFHTSKVYNAGWLRNVPYLREVMPDPTLQMNPKTAKARGIKDGDWVIVESPRGWLKFKADVNPGIRPDTVMALHGWYQGCGELAKPAFPILDGGANTNIMYSIDHKIAWDPAVTAMSSQTLVQVRKA